MSIDRVHSSFILRLVQRLSRLTFELRDVRTGQTWPFDSPQALASFLEAVVGDTADQPWSAGTSQANAGTPAQRRVGKLECGRIEMNSNRSFVGSCCDWSATEEKQ